MKKVLLCAFIAGMLAMTPSMTFAGEPTKAQIKTEKTAHPRIARSIKELRETITYLQKAPHDFGGHRAAAVAACEEAIKQLQEALEYRAEKDTK